MSALSFWTRLRFAVTLGVPLLVALLLVVPAGAQTFQSSFLGALDNNCQGLHGATTLGYGPQLGQICLGGGGVSSGNASSSVDVRGMGGEELLLQRLKARRDGTAGSADWQTALRGLSLFATAEYQTFDKDVTRFEPGYSRDTWGGTFGADYSFAGKGVIGLAFTYAYQDGDFGGQGGSFNTTAYNPTVYGSILVVPNLFIDLYAGYTRRDYVIDRRYSFSMGNTDIPLANAHGETNGNEAKAGVNVGYDFVFGRFTVGPRFGLHYWRNDIDSYSETGGAGGKVPTGLELRYEGQQQTSFTTTLGLFGSMAISTGIGVFVPQGMWEWVHEFENNQRVITYSFVQDLQRARLRFQTDPPDRDYFNAGLGLSLVLAHGIVPFVNVKQFFGYEKQSATTVTAGLRFSF